MRVHVIGAHVQSVMSYDLVAAACSITFPRISQSCMQLHHYSMHATCSDAITSLQHIPCMSCEECIVRMHG